VSINGKKEGTASFEGLGSAFVNVFLDEKTVSPSLVDDCLERRMEYDATDANMAVGWRTMLSFRVFMKRLSSWTSSQAAVQQDEQVSPGKPDAANARDTKQQEAEVVSELGTAPSVTAEFKVDVDGADSSNIALGTTGESDTDMTTDVEKIENQEEEVVAELDQETNLPKTASALTSESEVIVDKGPVSREIDSGVTNKSEPEIKVEVGQIKRQDEEDVSEFDSITNGSGGDAHKATDRLKSTGESDTGRIGNLEKTEQNQQLAVPDLNKRTDSSMNDTANFDANTVQSRIKELEAEIAAEIARVQSMRTQSTAVAVNSDQQALPPTITLASNDIAAQERDINNDSSFALKEAAQSSLEIEETQKAAEKASAETQEKIDKVEAKMISLRDTATRVSFEPKLEEGLYLVGVGVRKKAIINVYSVALYAHISALEALSPIPLGKRKKEAQTQLRNAARAFDASSPKTSFVLELVFKVDAQAIASAIAEAVRPRYTGPASDVDKLEKLIVEGGQVTKGTVLRFDCTAEGVGVSIDGKEQGVAKFEGMGSAFVDVFLDEKAVSPKLVDSCLSTWCGSGLL